ncbi:MAG: hypothetical protein LBU61_01780, partial [Coriobacteriales bacterium]|nr:hypothetical protein [Coriobacteriales bacterium]
MNKENNTIKKGKRRIAVVMASIMALTLILSATFAWYSTVNAENIFKNQSGDKSVVLHDDFEGGPIKRVYVENTSETSDIFVRIMLQEFMDLTSYTPRPLYANDFTTHTPDTFVHDCGLSNKFLELFHPNFTWVMGGQTWYLPCPQGENGTVNDLNDYSGDPNAKQTLDATVISMAVYNMKSPAEKQSFVGWVYDIDGWAYWSQPLAAQTATGLLLSAVNPHSNVQSLDYYYVINVLMEAVDRMDLPMWTVTSGNNDGKGQESVLGTGETSQLGSPDAIDMLNGISKPKSSVASIAVTTEPDKLTYAPDETFDPTGMVITVTYTDGTTEEITSGFAYSPKGALKDTDTEITISYGGATCKQQITISSLSGVEDLGIYDTFTVDGVSWTVINKQTISDRDYVLITTTNSVDTTRPLHNYWDEYQYEGSLIQSR